MFWPPYAHNCDALRSNFVDIFTQLVVAEGIVSGRIPRLIRSIAFVVATLPVLGMGIVAPADTAHADDCLAAPNAPSPQGRHWYYRLDWATQHKCWYLRALGRHAVSSRSISAADSAPMSVSSGDPDPASPNVKMPTVKPKIAPAITSIGDEPVQRRRYSRAGTSVASSEKHVIADSRPSCRSACRSRSLAGSPARGCYEQRRTEECPQRRAEQQRQDTDDDNISHARAGASSGRHAVPLL